MADDRLYLRCKKCGETTFFWKHYVGMESYLPHSENELSEWMKDHLLLCDGRADFGFNAPIEIITESERVEEDCIKALRATAVPPVE